MKKKLIRLTEQDLHQIVKESVQVILNEKLQSSLLRKAYQDTDAWLKQRGWPHQSLSQAHSHDIQAHGIVGRDGMWTNQYLDKITDDMIDCVTSEDEMSKYGFTRNQYNQICDSEGDARYVMRLKNGTLVVFKKDEDTIARLRELSQNSGKEWEERERTRNERAHPTYHWSTKERGRAFRDWKQVTPHWDDPEWSKKHNIGDWRKTSWVKTNMDNAIKSYGR